MYYGSLLITGAWVVTGGTDSGVMRLVGEAISEHIPTQSVDEKDIITLGIIPW